MALLCIGLECAFPPLALASSGAQIVTDGRTATTLDVNGSTTDIRTTTINGNAGFNSFSRFHVFEGNTVNLHLPQDTSALVNMVHDEASTIDGVLNAYESGRIGGDVYFLNPHGIMVGETGVINTGAIMLSAPTPDFMTALLSGNQVISQPLVAQVLEGDIPLSRSGVISVRGSINAVKQTRLSAHGIEVRGNIQSGNQAKVSIAEVLNLNNPATEIVDVTSPQSVTLNAGDNITITDATIRSQSINIKAEDNSTAKITLSDAQLVASDNITIEARSMAHSDRSGDGVGVAFTVSSSEAEVILEDNTSLVSSSGSVKVEARAETISHLENRASTPGLAMVGAISVTENIASTEITDNVSITAAQDISIRADSITEVVVLADASDNASTASIAIATGLVESRAETLVSGAASLSAGGDLSITADGETEAIFAARAGQNEQTGDIRAQISAALDNIDNTSDLDTTWRGQIENGLGDVLRQTESHLNGGVLSQLQIAGAAVYSKISDSVEASVRGDDGASVTAADNLSISAEGSTQSQIFASGRHGEDTQGGSAGIAIQEVENSVNAYAGDATLGGDNVSISAVDNNSFGIFAASGSGEGATDSVGIAGAIAVGLVETNETKAKIDNGTEASISDSLEIVADSTTDLKVKADGSGDADYLSDAFFAALLVDDALDDALGDETGSLGIGASVAVALHNNVTESALGGEAIFSTPPSAVDITAAQHSATLSEALSAGEGSVALVPVAAVSVAHNKAEALIEEGSTALNIGERLQISSSQDTETIAHGLGATHTDNDDGESRVGIGITAGVAVSIDSNQASLMRDITSSDGSISVASRGAKYIASGARASAVDDGDSESDDSDNNDAEGAISGLSGLASSLGGVDVSGFDLGSNLSTDTDILSDGADLGSIGGDGSDDASSLSIAAALGITYSDSMARAFIGDNVQINVGTGSISITSTETADIDSGADASTTGSDYALGGAVAVNIAQNRNIARVNEGASVTTGGLRVEASSQNSFVADTISGVGTGEFALAGSAAVNVVTANEAMATIASGAVVTAGGDLRIQASSDSAYITEARAVVGAQESIGERIEGIFSSLSNIDIEGDNGTSVDFSRLNSEALLVSMEIIDGEGGEGNVGVGAGIALGLILDEKTEASVGDNASIEGSPQEIIVNANATSALETHAFAGAKPDVESDDAKTSLDAAVAIGVLKKSVIGRIGTSQETLNANDNVRVSAIGESHIYSTAKGEVSASESAVGASVAVGVALEEIVASLERHTTSSGGVEVLADSDSSDIVLADAVAAGTVVAKYADYLSMEEEDLLDSSTSALGDVDNGANSLQALRGDFTDGSGAFFDTSGEGTSLGGEADGSAAEESGSINIAASVAASWADHKTRAVIADNIAIVANGDVTLQASNDANYRIRGSGIAVFADDAIGVGVGLLKTGQETLATLGEGASITTSQGDVSILAFSSENQGVDSYNNGQSFGAYASAEAIAGAGGGDLGIAGALSLVVSTDSNKASIGRGASLTSPNSIIVRASSLNKIVNRAWAVAVASDVTCSDPGNCDSGDSERTAVGASIAVSVVLDNNKVQLGEQSVLSAGDNITLLAEDLRPSNAVFALDPNDANTDTEDYVHANYTALLQNASYFGEAIAGGAAQGGHAGSGSLVATIALGKTETIIGEGASLTAENTISIKAHNAADARHLVGAVALADKKAIGASISGIYLREDVGVTIGAKGAHDDNRSTRIISRAGDIDIQSEAKQDSLTFMAAGGISLNDLALAGAFGFSVLDSDIESVIAENTILQATEGNIGINADSKSTIRNFALAVSASGGSSSAGGSLALNLFLNDKKAQIGSATASDNRISLNAGRAVNIGVNTKQEITNGIISASVSTAANALTGALSANIIKGESHALIHGGANVNDNTSLNASSANQALTVKVEDNTTITDLTGALAASTSTSVGMALAANVFWKDVKSGVYGSVIADRNVIISAQNKQNLTATTVGLAGSTGGFSGAGSIGVGLVKSATYADIGAQAVITTDGSVSLAARDDTDIFMLEPAASFSSGGIGLAGALGAAVFIGETKARVLGGANITAHGRETIEVATSGTQTSSPLLEGIASGDDNATREALGSFNDGFSFDTIKDLFLTETRVKETRRGVSVTAISDQDVISIAASGAVSSDSAIAISLSAGVGVSTTEASIGSGAIINSDISLAHASQDVLVRSVSDLYWVDLSAALGIGTGSAGVGVGGDVVVLLKDTDAFIAEGAEVRANRDISTQAIANNKVINSAATIGIGSTAGVSGTAAVGVILGSTDSRIDGMARAERNIGVAARSSSELIQIAGAVGGGGTAGIGASFGVAVLKGETSAVIGRSASVDAKERVSVTADSQENAIAAVLAGGIGGTVGVSVSGGIKVHQSETLAAIEGTINQNFRSGNPHQDVVVRASNTINAIDVIGGIGGGGTVGVGASISALVLHNRAEAFISGDVYAERNIDIEAASSKTSKTFTLAGAAGGTVSVAGNVAVLLVGGEADSETDKHLTGDGNSNIADEADSRNSGFSFASILGDNASEGDYSMTGDTHTEVASEVDSKENETQIGNKFNDGGSSTSLNQTKAYIAEGASITAGDNLTIEASDTTDMIFTAGAIGGAGVVGVGVTVGVLLVNSTAEAFIGEGAEVNAGGDTLITARTNEEVNSGALSAGGAGIASVQGVVMAQVVRSKTRAYIADNASINQANNDVPEQDVGILALSNTSLLSVSGSGGGALVGVGISGDAVVLDKETRAYIGENAEIASGGDITIDAESEADIIQIALSVNGGLVGVTGAAGIIIGKSETTAQIGSDSVLVGGDSIRLQSHEDIEIHSIVVAGAGGVVGGSGGFGVYNLKGASRSVVGEGASIDALGLGDGLQVLSGEVDSITSSTLDLDSRNQDGEAETASITTNETNFTKARRHGVAVVALGKESITIAPVGAGFGAVGLAGVVASTTSSSTTEAIIGEGSRINYNQNEAGDAQDLYVLATSETGFNSFSSGISAGVGAISLTADHQAFAKAVRARILGNAKAKRDILVRARTDNTITQTALSAAVGGVGVGGIVGVSVISDEVLAEIGDNTNIRAGNALQVIGEQDISVIQSAGNIAGGIGGGVGASLMALILQSSNTARIGNNADVAARRGLSVRALSNTHLNQNTIGFAGGIGLALSGSVGINLLKAQTLAEIANRAQINQDTAYNDNETQSVSVIANDTITTQGAAGAAAVGGIAGVGIGVVATQLRNRVKAKIGNGVVLAANDDLEVRAQSATEVANQGIAFGGGIGLGAAGSVALTLIGGTLSDNASGAFTNDNGDMLSDAGDTIGSDRMSYESEDGSAKANASAYTEDDDREAGALMMSLTADFEDDLKSNADDSTRAEIGIGAELTVGGDVSVVAEKTLNLSQISGGAAIGAVGVGGFVAVADYAGEVVAVVGSNTRIDNASSFNLMASLASEGEGVNSLVTGASVGIVGLAASIAEVNLDENVNARIGENVVITTADDSADIMVSAEKSIEAEALVAAVAGGVVSSGISSANLNASGDVLATIGRGTQLGNQDARLGSVTISARNTSRREAEAVSGGFGFGGALMGASVSVSDSGLTQVALEDDVSIHASEDISFSSEEHGVNRAEARGVAIAAGIGLAGVFGNVEASRDAEVVLGDNTNLAGENISVEAEAGDTNHNLAHVYTLAGAGGALVGATGTLSAIVSDSDSRVRIGQGARLNDRGSTRISSLNQNRGVATTSGISVGLVAIGANFAYLTDTSDSVIELGSEAQIESAGVLEINAQSRQRGIADVMAGSGGGLAATGGVARVTDTAQTSLIFADNNIGTNSSSIRGGDSIALRVINEDSYDYRLDASSVGGVQVAAGAGVTEGVSDLDLRIGDGVHLSSGEISLLAHNAMAKRGVMGANFAVRGGGGISVSLGTSRGNLTQATDLVLGSSAQLTTDRSDIRLTAISTLDMEDEAEVNVGGVVSVPRSDSEQTALATTNIRIGDNASIQTAEGNLIIEAQTTPNVIVRALTSTYGLVGAAAEARAIANITKTDKVIFENNAAATIHGNLDIYAGRLARSDHPQHRIATESLIWNHTAIPITTGKHSEIDFANNAAIEIKEGASLKTTNNIKLLATKLADASPLSLGQDYKYVRAIGEAKSLYSSISEAILDGNYTEYYGNEVTSGLAGVVIDGNVETGIEKDVRVEISSALNDFYDDNGTVNRRRLRYDNATGAWQMIDDAIVAENFRLEEAGDNASRVSPVIGIINDNFTVENARWSLSPERDFAKNVKDEIVLLERLLLAYPEGSTEASYTADNGSDNVTVSYIANYGLDILQQARTQIEERIAFLRLSLASYGDGEVAVIVIDDIKAATGNANIIGDYLGGAGRISTPSGETVTINNHSSLALQVGAIDIPDVAGGQITFNGIQVLEGADINTLNGENLPSDKTQNLTLISQANSVAPSVVINNYFNPSDSRYNPLSLADVTAPSLELAGNIRNLRGSVEINSQSGTIFSKASVIGDTVTIASGGDYVFDADENFYHVNGNLIANRIRDPLPTGSTTDTLFDYATGANTIAGMDSRSYNNECTPASKQFSGWNLREGQSEQEAYQQINNGADISQLLEPSFIDTPSTCSGSFARVENNGASIIAASQDVFISANNLNINGLIQAGITNKNISVNQQELNTALEDNPHSDDILVKQVDKTLTGSIIGDNDSRTISGDIAIRYNRNTDQLYIDGADVRGGNLVVAGNIISTGGGRLVVADGYGQVEITNLTDKEIQLTNISTGGMEGKITIVDKLKSNGQGGSLITEYTRSHQGGSEQLIVKNNMNSNRVDQLVSSPDYFYTPAEGSRYNFMTGEQSVERESEYRYRVTEKLWGVGLFDLGENYFEGTAASTISSETLIGEDLLKGEYISMDSAPANEAYRFKSNLIETSRRLVRDDSGLDICEWGGFLDMVRYCRYSNVKEYVVGALTYNYHRLKADEPISIGFSGERAGRLSVTSSGGIEISGQIRNPNGEVALIATGGDIRNRSKSDSIQSGDLTLTATLGSIGEANNPIRLRQEVGSRLAIEAGGDVSLASPIGSLYVDSITTSGTGAIKLTAHDDVFINRGGVLRGHSIEIEAETGMATSADGFFQVDTNAEAGGVLSVIAGRGNLDIREVAGDLRVREISTPDNISLTVIGGDLLDGNDEQEVDSVAVEELADLIDRMGLRGAAAEAKKEQTINTYQASVEALYRDYFGLRNLRTDNESNFIFDPYDPNFAYIANEAERTALGNDLLAIGEYEAYQQARYQAGHAQFGNPTEYDENFTYTATEAEIASITNGFEWSDTALNTSIPFIGLRETIDTTLTIEEANISGNNISIRVDDGSVGALVNDFSVDLHSQDQADYNLDSLDNATRLALAAAGSEDIDYDNETGILSVEMFEDFDLEARGNVNISARGVIYLGSENTTRIERTQAGGDVRIKIDGNVLNGRSDDAAAISGQAILLESGKGALGSEEKLLTIDSQEGHALTARARHGIYLGETQGNLRVANIYTPRVITLRSAGRIIDSAHDTITDIKGEVVNLIAEGSIGLEPSQSDSDQERQRKALDVATTNSETASLSVESSSDGAWLYTQAGEPIRLTQARLAGDLDMAAHSDLKVEGSLTTEGGEIFLRSFGNLNLDSIGGIATHGSALTISAGDNIRLSGSVATAGGDISAIAGDNFTLTQGSHIASSGGDIMISADALADGLGLQHVRIEDTATIDLGRGRLFIEASDGVYLTGIRSSSTAEDAVVVRADIIQDGGNSHADITTEGGGVGLWVHRYVNLNRLDNDGETRLRLAFGGKNENARAIAALLGIESEAGVEISEMSVNSGAIYAPISNYFAIENGRIRDTLFLTVGSLNARIGRQHDVIFSPDSWLLAADPEGYFDGGALTQSRRDEDYRCNGFPAFITDANAILDFSFSFDNPSLECSGVLIYYKWPFVVDGEFQTNEQILNNQIAGILRQEVINLRRAEIGDTISQDDNPYFSDSDATRALLINRALTQETLNDEYIGIFRNRFSSETINLDGIDFLNDENEEEGIDEELVVENIITR